MSLERINRDPEAHKISNKSITRTFTDGEINLPQKERAMYQVFGQLFKKKQYSTASEIRKVVINK